MFHLLLLLDRSPSALLCRVSLLTLCFIGCLKVTAGSSGGNDVPADPDVEQTYPVGRPESFHHRVERQAPRNYYSRITYWVYFEGRVPKHAVYTYNRFKDRNEYICRVSHERCRAGYYTPRAGKVCYNRDKRFRLGSNTHYFELLVNEDNYHRYEWHKINPGHRAFGIYSCRYHNMYIGANYYGLGTVEGGHLYLAQAEKMLTLNEYSILTIRRPKWQNLTSVVYDYNDSQTSFDMPDLITATVVNNIYNMTVTNNLNITMFMVESKDWSLYTPDVLGTSTRVHGAAPYLKYGKNGTTNETSFEFYQTNHVVKKFNVTVEVVASVDAKRRCNIYLSKTKVTRTVPYTGVLSHFEGTSRAGSVGIKGLYVHVRTEYVPLSAICKLSVKRIYEKEV